jgi:hypothetical protein
MVASVLSRPFSSASAAFHIRASAFSLDICFSISVRMAADATFRPGDALKIIRSMCDDLAIALS